MSDSTLFDRTFRDSEGNVVIAQPPNLPIITWLVATGVSLLPVDGPLHLGAEAIAFGAIFTWAWLELFQGVNYFRRSLGLIVLVIVVASQLR